jgi:hypothetical protein
MIESSNWVTTLGILNVTINATNTMAWYFMAPYEGHPIASKCLFGYLRKHPDGQILIDPNQIDHSSVALKSSLPMIIGENSIQMQVRNYISLESRRRSYLYVDADHVHAMVT